jgi:hypothetical protein
VVVEFGVHWDIGKGITVCVETMTTVDCSGAHDAFPPAAP